MQQGETDMSDLMIEIAKRLPTTFTKAEWYEEMAKRSKKQRLSPVGLLSKPSRATSRRTKAAKYSFVPTVRLLAPTGRHRSAFRKET
jgi:hypothetical protein